MELPNSIRIALLLLSVVSFLPQIRLLYTRRDSPGLSLFYVLFNLIVATELFTISFFCIANHRFEEYLPHVFVHDPPDVGDVINLAQFASVWVLWLVIFIGCVAWRSELDRGRRIAVSGIYAAFLLISVVPVSIDAITASPRDQIHKWDLAVFGAMHIRVVNPVVNTLGLVGLYMQAGVVKTKSAKAKLADSSPGTLSMVGLAAQAVVFSLLAVSWLGRLPFPWKELEVDAVNWAALKLWFGLVGFVSFDYAVFAVGQSMLLWLTLRQRRYGKEVSEGYTAEIESLLGD